MRVILLMRLLFLFLFGVPVMLPAQQLIPYLGMKGWGFADTNGNIVVPPSPYAQDMLSWPGVARIELRKGKPVALNEQGKVIADANAGGYFVRYVYDWELHRNTHCILHSPWIGKNDSVYYEIKDCQKSGYFVVQKSVGSKRGVIDSTGKIIVPLTYEWFSELDSFLVATAGEFMGVFSYKGVEIIPPVYRLVVWDQTGMFVCNKEQFNYDYRDSNLVTDFRDAQGKLLFSLKGIYDTHYPYDRLVMYGDSIRFFSLEGEWLFSVDAAGGNAGYITSRYIQVVKRESVSGAPVVFELYSRDGRFIRRDSAEDQVLLDNGNFLLFSNTINYTSPADHTGKVCDTSGNVLATIPMDWLEWVPGPHYAFSVNGKSGWISGYDGHVMVPPLYELYIFPPGGGEGRQSFSFVQDCNFIVGKDSMMLLLDSNGVPLAGPFRNLGTLGDFVYTKENDSIVFYDRYWKRRAAIRCRWFYPIDNEIAEVLLDSGGYNLLRISDLSLLLSGPVHSYTQAGNLFRVSYSRQIPSGYRYADWYVDRSGREFIDPELKKKLMGM